MSRITRLSVHDFKRIELVELEPHGGAGTVVVAGNNGHGKSSVLDAIQAALGGKRATPVDPIRHGARRAEIILETDEFKILRTFSGAESRLEVWGPTGKLRSPQTVLDGLTKALTFDPIAFERLDPKAQAETLRQLAGLDTSAEELAISRAFDVRRDLNREVKVLEARAGGPRPHPKAPARETPVSEVVTKLEAARARRQAFRQLQQDVLGGERDLVTERTAIAALEREIAARKVQLVLDEAALAQARVELGTAETQLPDVDAISAELIGLDSLNAQVRANAEHDRLAGELDERRSEAEDLTEQIEGLRATIEAKIAAATFPIGGLAVTSDGVEYLGVPFAQASAAERLRVSAAIGLALNPLLRILLIRDGSLLDEGSLAALDAFATEHDCQVWLEVVGEREGAAIVLEDGRAKALDAGKVTAA